MNQNLSYKLRINSNLSYKTVADYGDEISVQANRLPAHWRLCSSSSLLSGNDMFGQLITSLTDIKDKTLWGDCGRTVGSLSENCECHGDAVSGQPSRITISQSINNVISLLVKDLY